MTETIASLVAYIGANVDDALNGFKQVQSGIADVSASLLKTGAALTAGLTVPIVGFLTATVKAASDEETVLAQLNAVLKSTAGAAGVTAKQVTDMGDSLSQTTRFSKDAVISAENLLLTFTGIGKGVFPDATQAVLDMSQALGQDLKSSAIQLGKALQDPEKGIAALKRVGVNFTEAQKETISTMIKAGNVMGAQKLILAELTREFGGSAKAAGNTFAGKLDILNHAFTAIQVKIGNIILPILTKFIGFISTIVDKLGKLSPQIIEMGLAVAAALALLGPFLSILGAIGTVLSFLASGPVLLIVGAIAALGVAFATNFGGIRDIVLPIIQNIINAVGLFVAQLGDFVSNVQKFGLAKALESALNLGDGKKYATGWIEGVLIALGVGKDNAIKIVNDLSAAVKGDFSGIGDLLISVWKDLAPKIGTAVTNLITSIGGFIETNVPKVIAGFITIFDGIANWISTSAWPAINGAIQTLIGNIADWLYGGGPQSVILAFGNIIVDAAQWIIDHGWDTLQSAFTAVFNSVEGFVSGPGFQKLINGLVSALTQAANWLSSNAWPLLRGAFESIWNNITQGFIDAITAGIKAVASHNQNVDTTPGPLVTVGGSGSLAPGFPGSRSGDILNGVLGAIRGHAGGGQAPAGTPILVGERGPEVFRPNTSGSIIPNGALGGGNGGVIDLAMSLDSIVEHLRFQIAGSIATPLQ